MNLEEALKNIKQIDNNARSASESRWLSVVKPLFSLGSLEKAVTQIAGIKGEPFFALNNKTLVIMCADNGVVKEGISQCGSEITCTVAKSFINKKSSVCIMAERAGVKVLPVDIGMADDIENIKNIKFAYSTQNIADGPAMTRQQCIAAIENSIDIVGELKKNGCDIILTGEMGIGNTTTASAVTSIMLDKEPEDVTGKCAGLAAEGLLHKIEVIKKAIFVNRPDRNDPIDVISKVGGFDIAGMTGLFIGGAVYGIPIVIDGFISSVAALSAVRLDKRVKNFILPSHVSNEPAGKMLLDELGLKAFINCGMFLGEGSGAVALMPLLDMAVDVYSKLGTFDKWEHDSYKVLR